MIVDKVLINLTDLPKMVSGLTEEIGLLECYDATIL